MLSEYISIPCNKYFTEHPEMILGKMEFDKRMQGKYGEDSKITVCSPLYDDDPIRFENDLNRAVANIKGTIDTQRTVSTPAARTADILPADPDVRNFTHTMVNGQLYFRKNDEMIRVSETGKRLERMIGLHEIREAVFNVINAQIEDCSDKELKALQDKLNSVYDRFVKKNGNVNDKANRNVFGSDDDYNTLCALEVIPVKIILCFCKKFSFLCYAVRESTLHHIVKLKQLLCMFVGADGTNSFLTSATSS